jgi:cellobiose phosphorylase
MSRFDSTYGHFSDDGLEYVITTPDTPKPWVNVISNGDHGLVVSQAGGGYSFRQHANLNRLTRWSQDLLRDEWGKWLYLRDEETGAFWSATYMPTRHETTYYRCRHGLGYTVFEQRVGDIESELTVFAAPDKPCEIWKLELRNVGTKPRKLSATSYFEWNLGAPDPHREFHKLFIVPEFAPAQNALFARKLLWEVPTDRGHWNTDWNYVAFHGASEAPASFDCDKASFVGRHRGPERPQAMETPDLAGNADRWGDACASLRLGVTLAPGASHTLIFTLGAGDDRAQADELIAAYGNVAAADTALAGVKAAWQAKVDAVKVETPDPAFDLLTNVWLKYQAISGHMWARAAYYQQSGAFGFRDQLQTSQIWLPIDPSGMRQQLVLHAKHQQQDGTVLHWWHPLTEQGHVTKMTDDMLWLPFMTISYLEETADFALLDELVPYYDGGEGTFREHCQRAIGVVLGRMSPRGLPLIGEGDWCDGFSAVGLAWKGESIWLGHFLYRVLTDWATLDERLGVFTHAPDWRIAADSVYEALNTHGWNGDWFLCATKDDGTPMGDSSNDQNQCYLNSQTWAVLAGSTSAGRARQAMVHATSRLEGDNGLMLFRPAYHTPDRQIGYITRYAPGLRENGGVYTHAATWGILAQAALGEGESAHRLFDKLNPISASGRGADRYVAEPYVLPGNIDGADSPNYGRAGWTWYTGSAGWMFTAGLAGILGVKASYDGLLVVPCLPPDWPEARVSRTFRGTTYDIHIKRGDVPAMRLDGLPFAGGPLPLFADGMAHELEVTI